MAWLGGTDLVQGLVAEYTGTVGHHALEVDVSAPGTYEVVWYASNARKGNTGLNQATCIAEWAEPGPWAVFRRVCVTPGVLLYNTD